MLPFFPSPYPDELLYSICARYHQRSCNSNAKATMDDLFGGPTVCAVVDLPSHLDHLSSRLPGTLNTPEHLIEAHTLLPLYAPFLPRKRLTKLIAWMKGTTRGGSIHMSIGSMASSVPLPHHLRYCSQCLEEDARKFGETYWHRSHQPSGVRLCHKHDTWLIENDSFVVGSKGKHDFMLAPERHHSQRDRSLQEELYFSLYRMIAQSVGWLLHHPNEHRLGLEVLYRKYVHYLRRIDLVTFSGRVAQRELIARFVAFYGEDFLRQVYCYVEKESEGNWLNSLVRKPRKASHPLRHLLLIHFLGLNPREFFQEEVRERQPFGRGPWPCLNPVARHCKKPIISHCEITRNTETGEPVGNFLCSCGFGYARTGPDKNRDDRFRRTRILTFGKLWEDELIRLVVEEGGSLRSAARALGVDVNTVKNHLYRLIDGNHLRVATWTNEREGRRMRWNSLVARHPDARRVDLRRMAPADFTWLYRHDRKWLYENLPSEIKNSNPVRCRVDWERRDEELASRIMWAAAEIQGMSGKPVRVTVCAIGRKLGVLTLLHRKLNQLPATKAKLERVVESGDAFKLRRVKHAVDELRKNEEPLRSWRISRLANVSPEYLLEIDAEIDKII